MDSRQDSAGMQRLVIGGSDATGCSCHWCWARPCRRLPWQEGQNTRLANAIFHSRWNPEMPCSGAPRKKEILVLVNWCGCCPMRLYWTLRETRYCEGGLSVPRLHLCGIPTEHSASGATVDLSEIHATAPAFTPVDLSLTVYFFLLRERLAPLVYTNSASPDPGQPSLSTVPTPAPLVGHSSILNTRKTAAPIHSRHSTYGVERQASAAWHRLAVAIRRNVARYLRPSRLTHRTTPPLLAAWLQLCHDRRLPALHRANSKARTWPIPCRGPRISQMTYGDLTGQQGQAPSRSDSSRAERLVEYETDASALTTHHCSRRKVDPRPSRLRGSTHPEP
jgi:hypothetical protein